MRWGAVKFTVTYPKNDIYLRVRVRVKRPALCGLMAVLCYAVSSRRN